MWGEVYEPRVDDEWPHNPHFAENSHERPFSIIPKPLVLLKMVAHGYFQGRTWLFS